MKTGISDQVGRINAGRIALAALALLFLMGALLGLGRLQIDNGLRVWFVDEDPALLAHDAFIGDFGNDEIVIIAQDDDRPLFSADRLRRLGRLTTALSSIDGVGRVISLTQAPFLPDEPWRLVAQEGPQNLVEMVEESPLGRRLVSQKGNATLILAWMGADEDVDQRRPEILAEIRSAAIKTADDSGEKMQIAGMGVMYEAINQATLEKGGIFIALSYLVIAGLLFFFLGDWRWVLATLAALTAADLALLGLMGWTGVPLTMYTMTLPSVVLILGVANGIHLSTALKGGRKLKSALVPCLLNALTTALGFWSLNAASVPITRSFGTFAGIGVLLAFFFSAVLAAFFLRSRAVDGTNLWAGRFVKRLFVHAHRRRRGVLGAAAFVLAAFGVGTTLVNADTRSIDFLPADHRFVQDHRKIESTFGPYVPVEVVVQPPPGMSWRDPTFLAALKDAQKRVEAMKDVGGTFSVVDVIEAADANPQTGLVEDLALFDLLAPPDALAGLVNEEKNSLRFTANIPMMGAARFKEVAHEVLFRVDAALPSGVKSRFGGYLPLNWQMAAHVVSDQMRSFAWAFFAVFLVLGLFLRSLRLMGVAVMVNLLPIVGVLGWMGFRGLRLDIASVTVCAAVLGIVVDDTIHLLHRFQKLRLGGGKLSHALMELGGSSGRAVLFTSLIFIAGFSTIALSSVPSVSVVGELTAVAVFFALLADLLVAPALLSALFAKRFAKGVKRVRAASPDPACRGGGFSEKAPIFP
jgi:predicted RND superfamily exporter protein